jgi:hypothetical protein
VDRKIIFSAKKMHILRQEHHSEYKKRRECTFHLEWEKLKKEPKEGPETGIPWNSGPTKSTMTAGLEV